MTYPIDWDLIAINNDALEPVELISRLIAAGMSVEAVSQKISVGTRVIYQFMKDNGIQPPTTKGRKPRGAYEKSFKM